MLARANKLNRAVCVYCPLVLELVSICLCFVSVISGSCRVLDSPRTQTECNKVKKRWVVGTRLEWNARYHKGLPAAFFDIPTLWTRDMRITFSSPSCPPVFLRSLCVSFSTANRFCRLNISQPFHARDFGFCSVSFSPSCSGYRKARSTICLSLFNDILKMMAKKVPSKWFWAV